MTTEQAYQRWLMGSARNFSEVAPIIAQTNIDQVDHEHRRLVQNALDMNAILVRLQQKGLSHRLIHQAQEMLEQLHGYASFHFREEEGIMERNRIPGLEAMHAQHEHLLARMRVYQEDFRAGRSFASLELKTEILEWVIGHINKTDFHTFSIASLESILAEASSWQQVAPFIKHTNIQFIDQDHHDIAAVLLDINAGRGAGPDAGLIDRLERISAGHFQREEELLVQRKIGLTPHHAAQHRSFLAKLAAVRRDPGTYRDLHGELVSWLVSHINEEDMAAFHHGAWLQDLMRRSDSPAEILDFLVSLDGGAIDHDHEEFIRRVFTLDKILDLDIEATAKARQLAEGLAELRRFALGHFTREEEIMARMDLPVIPRHLQEHHDLLAGLEQYAADMEDGLVYLGSSIRERLIGWWLAHTNGTDLETFRDWKS